MSKPATRILVVGTGGREHALAWRLSRTKGDDVDPTREVIVAPGNPGIARTFRCEPVETVADVVTFAVANAVALVVVGPEHYLDEGLGDALRAAGIPCFGPDKAAARLESSKAFMKDVAAAALVPTARHQTVRSVAEAAPFFASLPLGAGVVVKADGLCAGKGVVVCDDVDAGRAALMEMLGSGTDGPRFGAASQTVVLEERLPGPELSVFAVCSADDAVVLGAARDHKRLSDGDEGPNTGGMGAVGPLGANAGVDDDFLEDLRQRFFLPTLRVLKARGAPFQGVLFAGLMMDAQGAPSLLEFNVRFGDPETEALLYALDVDIFPLLLACATGTPLPALLADGKESSSTKRVGAVVVMAAEGYPTAPEKGAPIVGLMDASTVVDAEVFYAGVANGSFGMVVSGGRVLAVAGRGPSLETALARAYDAVAKIQFEGQQVRSDIGASLLVT